MMRPSSFMLLLQALSIIAFMCPFVSSKEWKISNNNQTVPESKRQYLRNLGGGILKVGASVSEEQRKAFLAAQQRQDGTRIVVICKEGEDCSDIIDSSEIVSADDEGLIIEADDNRLAQLQADERVEIEEDHVVIGFSRLYPTQMIKEIGVPMLHHGEMSYRRELVENVPYGIPMVQADQVEMGEDEVKVCIVDSGIAIGHPDLDATRIGGTNNVRNSNDILRWSTDIAGHGTHVAGIIAAAKGNDQGVRGVGAIRLHITRGLDDTGLGYESDVRKALAHCVGAGAKIINLSLGSYVSSGRMTKVYTNIVERLGIMLIAASGNDGVQKDQFPAAIPAVISVGAVRENGERAYFSTFNDQVELMAPGFQILSTTISSSAVMTDSFSFPAVQASSSRDEIQGPAVNCRNGDVSCTAAAGKICLMSRLDIDPNIMVERCETGGGIGAVLFWSLGKSGTWYYLDNASIPVLIVSSNTGLLLIRYSSRDASALISFGMSLPGEVEYTYDMGSGTSMAAPHVAAVAALVWSHFPECSNQQIRYALAISARDVGDDGCDIESGYGIVQAKGAFDFLARKSCAAENWPELPFSGGCSTLP